MRKTKHEEGVSEHQVKIRDVCGIMVIDLA